VLANHHGMANQQTVGAGRAGRQEAAQELLAVGEAGD